MRRTIIGFIITVALGRLCVAPPALEAQQPTHMHRVGALFGTARQGAAPSLEAFLVGMRALGYVEGQNLVMEYRWAEGQYERFPDLAAELVRLQVDVLIVGATPSALAAKHATTTIPIVMVTVPDPVGSGLVASLARPGGNVTGLAALTPELVGKQLEFLKDMLPTVSRVAILWNPANPGHALMVREADVMAQAVGVQLHFQEAHGPEAFDSAFMAMTKAPAGALLVLGDAMFLQHRRRLASNSRCCRTSSAYARSRSPRVRSSTSNRSRVPMTSTSSDTISTCSGCPSHAAMSSIPTTLSSGTAPTRCAPI